VTAADQLPAYEPAAAALRAWYMVTTDRGWTPDELTRMTAALQAPDTRSALQAWFGDSMTPEGAARAFETMTAIRREASSGPPR
jgi:hypothetical protein